MIISVKNTVIMLSFSFIFSIIILISTTDNLIYIFINNKVNFYLHFTHYTCIYIGAKNHDL